MSADTLGVEKTPRRKIPINTKHQAFNTSFTHSTIWWISSPLLIDGNNRTIIFKLSADGVIIGWYIDASLIFTHHVKIIWLPEHFNSYFKHMCVSKAYHSNVVLFNTNIWYHNLNTKISHTNTTQAVWR